MISPPPILYKYLDADGAIKTFENSTLKFSSPLSLNDPFECRYGGEPDGYREELLEKLYNAKDSPDEWSRVCRERLGLTHPVQVQEAHRDVDRPAHFEHQIDLFLEEFKKILPELHKEKLRKFSISSFSELPDNSLMWGHYADKHKGCVIGFESNALGKWYKVRYSSERICRPMTRDDVKRVSMDTMRTKSIEWEYEHEWRLIRPVEPPLDTEDGTLVWHIQPEAINIIILGLRADERLEQAIRVFKHRHPKCDVFRATIHPSEYRIEFSPWEIAKSVNGDESIKETGANE